MELFSVAASFMHFLLCNKRAIIIEPSYRLGNTR